MAKLRVFPHRQIGPSAIKFEGWHVRVGQAPEMPVAGYLPNFDYSSEMQFGFRAKLSLDQIRSSVGIDNQSTLAFYLLVDCENSNVRFKEVVTVAEGEEFDCWLTVPPGQLASKVKLERGLVLDELGSSDVWDSPKRRGALLFSDDPWFVQLEGDATRFPTQAIDFAADRLPEKAAWKLQISYDDPNQPFNSAVRLLINTRHPAHNALLAAERTTSSTRHCIQTSHVNSSRPCPETNNFLLNKNGETKALVQSSIGCVAIAFLRQRSASHPTLPPRPNAL